MRSSSQRGHSKGESRARSHQFPKSIEDCSASKAPEGIRYRIFSTLSSWVFSDLMAATISEDFVRAQRATARVILVWVRHANQIRVKIKFCYLQAHPARVEGIEQKKLMPGNQNNALRQIMPMSKIADWSGLTTAEKQSNCLVVIIKYHIPGSP